MFWKRSTGVGGEDNWNRSVLRLMHHIDEKNARTVGITGTQKGAGVSTLCRQFAQTLSNHGKTVLLVDGGVEVTGGVDKAAEVSASEIIGLARKERSFLLLEAAKVAGRMPATGDAMRHLFHELSKGMTVVVDLPPVLAANGAERTWQVDAAAACDIVYLVCLAGVTRKRQLADCMEMGRINGLKVSGLVSNDRRLIGSRMLANQNLETSALAGG